MSEGRYIGLPTHRDANHLALYMGHFHVVDYLKTIPEGSSVIDVGAGLSRLGEVAAHCRPDITWTNFDITYDHPEIMWPNNLKLLEELKAGASPNLSYVPGDILDPAATLGNQRFTRVNSLFMMMHVILNGREQGVKVIENLLSLADQDGTVTVGPIKDDIKYVPNRRGLSLELVPLHTERGNRALAELAVDAMQPFDTPARSLFLEEKGQTGVAR